jgi:predicted nucleotidyltransferase
MVAAIAVGLPEDNAYRTWYAFYMDILNQFLEELKADPMVRSVILFGSQARGDARQDSDIDLIVVCNLTRRGVEERDGQMFEIVYVTEQEAGAFYTNNKDNCVRTWESAKILFDRDGSAERLQNIARGIKNTGKEKCTGDTLIHARFDALDLLRALSVTSVHDETTALFLLYGKISDLLTLYFDVRGLWTPAPKHLLQALQKQDTVLHGLVTSMYRTDIPVLQKIALAQEVIERVFDDEG